MKRQSPINILTDETESINSSVRPLTINYNKSLAKKGQQNLTNNGYTWSMNMFGDHNLHFNGGPMNRGHNYELKSIHCHWGSTIDHGSEHTIDSLPYSGELHFVHWNSTAFQSFDEAINSPHPNSLAVFGVFIKIGETNDELQKIGQLLKLIKYKNDCITFPYQCDLENLLPKCTSSYWSYDGSLTTSPYKEIVQWIVFKEPIECSVNQIDRMRKLQKISLNDNWNEVINSNMTCICIEQNFRQTFEINDRIVYDYV